jgi:hypothetical protein
MDLAVREAVGCLGRLRSDGFARGANVGQEVLTLASTGHHEMRPDGL